jgi:predicted glycoside hydrolase/deacetylase ChbG (UPF0249 family)
MCKKKSILSRVRNRFSPTLAEQLGYSDKDVIVIVNIDDVGIHKDVTEASFRALNFGIVKSGSVMVPCPNFDQVIELWKENVEIDLGVHLTLTCEWGEKYPWSPVLPRSDVPSLYNPKGIMWATVKELLRHGKRKDIINELHAQINKILDAGLKPSHLDHHMDFYYHPDLFSDVMELSRKYNLPMRVWKRKKYKLRLFKNNLTALRKKGYVFPDTQMGIYTMGGQNQTHAFRREKYFEHMRSLKPGVHNIKVHIGFQTKELKNIMGSHYSSVRQIDYDVWSCEDTREIADELGIIFIGFRPLQELQGEIMKSWEKAILFTSCQD